MIDINKKKVTAVDVAHAAGVSQATVSLVLNGRFDSITQETVNRVQEAVKALGYEYKPQMRRRNQSQGANTIAIMASALPNPYYSELITSIEKAAEEEGLLTIVCNTYRSEAMEEKYLALASEMNVIGMIFTYVPVAVSAVQEISRRMPVVVVGDKSSTVALDAVEFDSFDAGRLLARHLLDLGHKHIAFLSTPMNTGNIARMHRFEGLRSEMCARGLGDCLTLRISNSEANYKDLTNGSECAIGYNQTLDVLKNNPEVTAFVGVNDMIAIGILNGLLAMGHRVPEDFSVCGFDNIHMSDLRSINLTTIDYFSAMKGKDALEILLRKRNQHIRKSTPSVVFRMEYAPKLIVRGTTGKCRKKTE